MVYWSPHNVAYDYVCEEFGKILRRMQKNGGLCNGNRFTVGKIKLADINNDKVINKMI